MHISDYQLYVNVVSEGEAYILKNIDLTLAAFKIKPAPISYPEANEYVKNKREMAKILDKMMVESGGERVPDKTPFYIGIVIISSLGHKCDLDNLVETLMDAMRGVVFKDNRWCDGISVIRDRDKDVNDCRIHVAWKVDVPEGFRHPLFGAN